ncbi:MAG: N4-gp56 family major capsid protein [Ignisphaera sp.]|nr:N4-gp56 family major capsid protein [Ignisphaera sp.]
MTTQVYGNGTTTASAGANTIVHFYDRAGIKAANAKNVYQQFASRKEMPTNMGKTFKISKFLHMYDRKQFDSNGDITADFAKYGYMTSRTLADVNAAIASAALPEASGAVNQQSIEKVTVETSFARFGKMIEYSDEVDLFSEDIIQTRYRQELGEDANMLNEDLIQRDMLATGTVMYSGVATSLTTVGAGSAANGSTDSINVANYDLVRRAVSKLVRNRAKRNTSIVTGTTKISTTPIARSYYAIIPPEVKMDLENQTRGNTYEREFAYVPVQKYADASSLAEGEVGSMYEVRFIESESALVQRGAGAAIPTAYVGSLAYTTFATDATAIAARGAGAVAGSYFDVFPILFPTQDAFATVGLKGNNKVTFNSASPAQVSIVNPYGTKGFFSYNFWYAGLILEEEKLLRVNVAASQ